MQQSSPLLRGPDHGYGPRCCTTLERYPRLRSGIAGTKTALPIGWTE